MSEQNEHNSRFLLLMRHAKSDWSDGSLSDHDRPLNQRGKAAAPAMADWLSSIGFVPGLVLSSTSVRTRQTVNLMTEQWADPPEATYDESLYLASPNIIFRAAREQGGSSQKLMIVAHNPGMSYVVSGLSDQRLDMPTAAIAIFELKEEIQWSEFQQSTPMELVHFMRPKAL